MLNLDSKTLTYSTKIGEDDVIIGNAKNPLVFEPHIEFTKWDKENSLSIKCDLISGTPTLTGNKIELSDSKIGWYANPDPNDPDNFKFGLILYEKPTTNTWSFQLEGWEEFDFRPFGIVEGERVWNAGQWCIRYPNLDTPELYRREKFNGGWGVKHKTKRDHIIGQTNYEDGSFGVFFRPRFIDANGFEVLGNIDIKDGIYTVTVPQFFLNSAVYPVKANDTFGKTTTTGDVVNVVTDYGYVSKGIPAGAGNVTKLSIYSEVSSGSINGKGLLYGDSGATDPETLLGATPATAVSNTTVAWNDFTFSSSIAVTASTTYWIGIVSADWTIHIYGNYETGHSYRDTALGYTSPKNPWTGGNTTYNGWVIACYATYTPSGGAVKEQLIMIG